MAKILLKKDIDEVVDILKTNKIIAFPTDTVFGLACLFNDFESIERIKKIKHRDANKPLPVMCNGLKMLLSICELTNNDVKLIDTIKKGAITYILNKKESVDSRNTNGFTTMGVRIPDDDFILKLITKLDSPLLVTSCNISNEPSIKYSKEVIEKFNDLVDVIIDEDARSEISSTIYNTLNGTIIREGIISLQQIKEILND